MSRLPGCRNDRGIGPGKLGFKCRILGVGEGGGNIALPSAALPMLIARFKAMADLDLTEQRALQHRSAPLRIAAMAGDARQILKQLLAA